MRWLIVMLLCVTGTALAAPQKVAVLPLEMTPPAAPSETRFSIDVTTALRAAMAADFRIVPARFVSLAAAKRATRCPTEASKCMAALGANLGADLLVFGKVKRTSFGYQVTFKVLDVARGQVLHAVSDGIAPNDSTGSRLAIRISEMYARIVVN